MYLENLKSLMILQVYLLTTWNAES